MSFRNPRSPIWALIVMAGLATAARADVDAVVEWNHKAGDLIAESKIGTPPAVRVMAIVQTAVADAARAAAGDPSRVQAAVAAANRTTLLQLLPAQQASIAAAFQAASATIPDGPAKQSGLAVGQDAAARVLAARADDGAGKPAAYRPFAGAGVYVPTSAPAVPQGAARKPWLLSNAGQFLPPGPPALDSAEWARDYQEVRELGARASSRRSPEQTEIARFWEYSLPAIYFGVVESVARQPGRDPVRNASLYAAAAQAMDDALIAVFDAKYHHHFWRPITAIRNGDLDGHDGTERDPSWTSLIDAPLHPEYPSGHSVLAASIGAVLKAELGAQAGVTLATRSPTAKGAVRQWSRVDDFVQEVSDARVWAGIHFRSATKAGETMGWRIGELAGRRWLQPAH